MNKAGLATAALALLIFVWNAADGSARKPMGEQVHWSCGSSGNDYSKEADAPALWTNNNDKICMKTCTGTYAIYRKGNWALFTDGLFCCCSTFRLLGDRNDPLAVATPHISDQMALKLGIRSGSLPSD